MAVTTRAGVKRTNDDTSTGKTAKTERTIRTDKPEDAMQNRSYLLELPPELRNRIYHFASGERISVYGTRVWTASSPEPWATPAHIAQRQAARLSLRFAHNSSCLPLIIEAFPVSSYIQRLLPLSNNDIIIFRSASGHSCGAIEAGTEWGQTKTTQTMPLVITSKPSTDGENGAASYIFDPSNINPEAYPWLLQEPVSASAATNTGLCWRCRQLDFGFLFQVPVNEIFVPWESEPGPVRESGKPDVTNGRLVTLERGICLGTLGEIAQLAWDFGNKSNPSSDLEKCSFCSLVYHTIQEHKLVDKPDMKDLTDSLNDEDEMSQTVHLKSVVRGPTRLIVDRKSASKLGCPYAVQFELELDTNPAVDELVHALLSKLLDFSGSSTLPLIQMVVHNPPTNNDEISLYGRKLGEGVMDFGVAKRWIARCHEKETNESFVDSNGEHRGNSLRIRLIDVHRGCIIGPLYAPPDYVALSYVWGKAKNLMLESGNQAILQADGAISTDDRDIPQTIRDAILACQRLSERYLWVDSLCILQDSPEKINEICQMDAIYQEAKFTIVAACGTDSNAGLPGVRPNSRPATQHVVQIKDVSLGNVLTGLKPIVNKSHWNTRGWTYQERLLSLRKLYFATTQIFLECPHGVNNEDDMFDCHADIALDTLEYLPGLDYGNTYHILPQDRLNLHIYDNIVNEYCLRSLSHEEDILDAFQGVANVLQKELFCGSPVLFGIPLCLLDLGLLWRPLGSLGRRRRRCIGTHGNGAEWEKFPSWSWMGWKGLVKYFRHGNISESLRSCVEWLHASDTQTCIEREWTGMPLSSWLGWSLWERHVDIDVEIYYTLRSGRSSRKFCHPIPDVGSKISTPIDQSTGYLHLRGEVAKLYVTDQHTGRWNQDERCTTGDHGISSCQLWVYDSSNSRCGIVYMDGNTFLSSDISPLPQAFDFVKLSQQTFFQGSGDPAWDETVERYTGEPGKPGINKEKPEKLGPGYEEFDEDKYDLDICWCLYNVLMVQWKNGVAYRIGIGTVHIEAFDHADPEWRTISLG